MENNVTALIKGLKCDNPTCDYRDDSITVEEYESYLNKPCPNCGSPLLTQADYDQVQNILLLMSSMNNLPLLPNHSDEKVKMSFHFNGTGNVNLKVEPYNDKPCNS